MKQDCVRSVGEIRGGKTKSQGHDDEHRPKEPSQKEHVFEVAFSSKFLRDVVSRTRVLFLVLFFFMSPEKELAHDLSLMLCRCFTFFRICVLVLLVSFTFSFL